MGGTLVGGIIVGGTIVLPSGWHRRECCAVGGIAVAVVVKGYSIGGIMSGRVSGRALGQMSVVRGFGRW